MLMFFEALYTHITTSSIWLDEADPEELLESLLSLNDPARLGADDFLLLLHHTMHLLHLGKLLQLLLDHPRLLHFIQLRLLDFELRSSSCGACL